MHHDIRKRLSRLEAQSIRLGQTRFFRVEGPPDLSNDAAYAFLRERGHRWEATDLVFLTMYEGEGLNPPLRDLTERQHGVAP